VLTKTAGKTSSGTGVLIDAEKKLVVTNFHVVGEARNAIVFFPAMKDDKPIVTRKHYVDNVKTLGLRGRVMAVDRKRSGPAARQAARGAEGDYARCRQPQAGRSSRIGCAIGASDALWVIPRARPLGL
jgi:hypothetical protein